VVCVMCVSVACVCVSFMQIFPEGGHWDPKWLYVLHAPRAGGPNLPASSSSLLCRNPWNQDFSVAELLKSKLRPPALAAAAWTQLFEQPCIWPARALNWVVFVCWSRVGVLIMNNDHCKNIGAKRASGWRGMQIIVPFPLESTHLGYRFTTCAFSPVILYAGRLV